MEMPRNPALCHLPSGECTKCSKALQCTRAILATKSKKVAENEEREFQYLHLIRRYENGH